MSIPPDFPFAFAMKAFAIGDSMVCDKREQKEDDKAKRYFKGISNS